MLTTRSLWGDSYREISIKRRKGSRRGVCRVCFSRVAWHDPWMAVINDQLGRKVWHASGVPISLGRRRHVQQLGKGGLINLMNTKDRR